MALSKELIQLYIICACREGTSESTFGLLAVSEFDKKQLRSKLETIKKQTWKGVKIASIALDQVNTLNEKLFKDILQAVFSSGKTGFLCLEFANTSSRKEAELFSDLLDLTRQAYPGCSFAGVCDSSVRKAVSTKALKKAGIASLSKDETAADEILLETASFLVHLAAADTEEKSIASLQELENRQLIGSNRKILSGDALCYEKSLKNEALKAAQNLLKQEGHPAAELIDFWMKKKAEDAVYINGWKLIQQGMDLEGLSKVVPSKIAKEYDRLKEMCSLTESLPFDSAWKEALLTVCKNAQPELEDQKPENFDLMKQDLEQAVRRLWKEYGYLAGSSRIIAALDEYGWSVLKVEEINRLLKADWTDEKTRQDNREFFLNHVRLIRFDNTEEGLEDLSRLVLDEIDGNVVHADLALLRLLKKEMYQSNQMGRIFETDVRDEDLLEAAKAFNLVPVSAAQWTGEKRNSGRQWLLLDQPAFKNLQESAFELLSDPAVSISFAPRLAKALSKGLDVQSLMDEQKVLDPEDWSWYLRKKTLSYLFTTRKQKFLRDIADELDLESFDLIANPKWTIGQMSLIAATLDQGMRPEHIRSRISQGMSLSRMEKALQSAELKSETEEKRIRKFVDERVLEKALQKQYEQFPESIRWMNESLNPMDLSRKLANLLENERELIPIIYKYIIY